MRSSGEKKAVIVGGGIAGPVLGTCLRRLGWDVVVAEARPVAATLEGAFLGLAPNGMNALETLELATPVRALGHACSEFRFWNRKGHALGTIDRSSDERDFGHSLTMIRRGDLHALLADAAERAGVKFRRELRLTALDAARGLARFADGTELEGEVVIGCDGLRSTTRALVFPEAPPPRFSGLFDYGGFSPLAPRELTPGANEMVFGRRAFFGAFVTPAQQTWWFHNGPPPEANVPADADARERLAALHADDPPWIAQVIRATPRVLGPWPLFELDSLPAWSRKRVALLGDAAHAMSPSAGQGASLAIEDAIVLSRALERESDFGAAFETYERERRPRAERIAKLARRNSSGKAPTSAFAESVRDFVLPFFLKLGGKAQASAYGYRVDVA